MASNRPSLSIEEVRQAIKARKAGNWDSPALVKFGPLSTSADEDIEEIILCADIPSQTFLHAHCSPANGAFEDCFDLDSEEWMDYKNESEP